MTRSVKALRHRRDGKAVAAVTEVTAAQLAGLAVLDGPELRRAWARLTDTAPPRVSPAILRLALGHAIQTRTFGGLTRATRQRLDQIAAAKTRSTPLSPGMRLVREWNGNVHVVTIGDDDVIHWNDREWRSLSQVARAITGTSWSGPAFFGLKHKVAA